MNFPKPDYSNVCAKVDCTRRRKPKIDDNDKVSGGVTCRMVQMKLRYVPRSFLTFPFPSLVPPSNFASIMLYSVRVI